VHVRAAVVTQDVLYAGDPDFVGNGLGRQGDRGENPGEFAGRSGASASPCRMCDCSDRIRWRPVRIGA
jgi:hypothetical protein